MTDEAALMVAQNLGYIVEMTHSDRKHDTSCIDAFATLNFQGKAAIAHCERGYRPLINIGYIPSLEVQCVTGECRQRYRNLIIVIFDSVAQAIGAQGMFSGGR